MKTLPLHALTLAIVLIWASTTAASDSDSGSKSSQENASIIPERRRHLRRWQSRSNGLFDYIFNHSNFSRGPVTTSNVRQPGHLSLWRNILNRFRPTSNSYVSYIPGESMSESMSPSTVGRPNYMSLWRNLLNGNWRKRNSYVSYLPGKSMRGIISPSTVGRPNYMSLWRNLLNGYWKGSNSSVQYISGDSMYPSIVRRPLLKRHRHRHRYSNWFLPRQSTIIGQPNYMSLWRNILHRNSQKWNPFALYRRGGSMTTSMQPSMSGQSNLLSILQNVLFGNSMFKSILPSTVGQSSLLSILQNLFSGNSMSTQIIPSMTGQSGLLSILQNLLSGNSMSTSMVPSTTGQSSILSILQNLLLGNSQQSTTSTWSLPGGSMPVSIVGQPDYMGLWRKTLHRNRHFGIRPSPFLWSSSRFAQPQWLQRQSIIPQLGLSTFQIPVASPIIRNTPFFPQWNYGFQPVSQQIQPANDGIVVDMPQVQSQDDDCQTRTNIKIGFKFSLPKMWEDMKPQLACSGLMVTRRFKHVPIIERFRKWLHSTNACGTPDHRFDEDTLENPDHHFGEDSAEIPDPGLSNEDSDETPDSILRK